MTFPSLMGMLPSSLMHLPLVYDCMDDALGFPASSNRLAQLAEAELRLVKHASRILCSSGRLRDILTYRYGIDLRRKTAIVHNAISSSILATCTIALLRLRQLI